MKTKVVLIAVLGTALLVWAVINRNGGKPASPPITQAVKTHASPAAAASVATAPPEKLPGTEDPKDVAENDAWPAPVKTNTAPLVKAPKQATKETQPQTQLQPASGKEPIADPMARVALSMVGADPYAEIYWMTAINDPDLSAHERQDLIEDLNEDGLSDPKHPTLEDLPLILNRLRIIEELGPFAMDKVNADAFAEAYKDLVNLAALATGGGEAVK